MTSKTPYAVSDIPPVDSRNYNVDVQIRIYRDGERFGADIFAEEQVQRVPIEMTVHDVKELNDLLQKSMDDIVWKYGAGEESTSFKDYPPALSIVEAGHFAFMKIFGHSAALDVIKNIMKLSRKITLQIVSEDFFLPWELLYPLSPGNQLSYEHFWGMNFVIARIIPRQRRPEAFIHPTIKFSSCPNLGFLADVSMPAVASKEAPFLERLQSSGQIQLSRLQTLDADNKISGIEEFKDFWNQTFELAHFAGHASYVTDTPSRSYLMISTDFPITLQDFEIYGFEIKGNPLFIMNACETGNLNPLYTSHFATTLLNHGARGVVATEWAIPDSFAADFAEQLYNRLLAGDQLGDSLLAARRHFLSIKHNPLGLLYSMYAQPSTRLVLVEEEQT